MKITVISFTLCFALILCSCVRKQPLSVIPDKDTAESQYLYAYMYHKSTIPPAESQALHAMYIGLILRYQKVVERFPDDMQYTPEAILHIARLMNAQNQNQRCVNYLEAALPLYRDKLPQFEARALYRIGLSLDRQKKYAEAKVIYKECTQKFSGYTDPVIKDSVMRCNRLYNAAHIEAGA
ncbi:tetratricopeptide repeat protein [Candidatus Sumerlaeota bacterium]|nr:tetratricopeptide repeat protein [Candidatus Sumerlaeota bacterium]